MPSVHDTAYSRLKAAVTARDLVEVYTVLSQVFFTGHLEYALSLYEAIY
jgi:hypothetical protein